MEDIRTQLRIIYYRAESATGPSLGWPIAIAALLHVFLLKYYTDPMVGFSTVTPKVDDAIVIDTLDENARRPVVTTTRSDEQENDLNPAPFHSDVRNRVKKQTRASLQGKFQEGISNPGQTEGSSVDSEGFGLKLGMEDLMSLARTPHAFSKDIPEGGQTVLNTDKVLYASFINRIAEEIYEPWVAYAQEAIKEIMNRGKKIEPTLYITKLNVVMNEMGEVVAMTVMGASGLPELDDAPKRAFWKIARFNNPPAQLIDKDGLIRLNYEFHFEWKSTFFNIVPHEI